MGNYWVSTYEEDKRKLDRKLYLIFSKKKKQQLKNEFLKKFGITSDYDSLSNDGEIAQDQKRLDDYKKFCESGALKDILNIVAKEY